MADTEQHQEDFQNINRSLAELQSELDSLTELSRQMQTAHESSLADRESASKILKATDALVLQIDNVVSSLEKARLSELGAQLKQEFQQLQANQIQTISQNSESLKTDIKSAHGRTETLISETRQQFTNETSRGLKEISAEISTAADAIKTETTGLAARMEKESGTLNRNLEKSSSELEKKLDAAGAEIRTRLKELESRVDHLVLSKAMPRIESTRNLVKKLAYLQGGTLLLIIIAIYIIAGR